MSGRTVKKGILLLTVLAMVLTSAVLPALAEEAPGAQQDGAGAMDGADGEASAQAAEAGHRIVRTQVVDLGKVPDETKCEEDCESLLVVDVSTGVLLHEKNINLPEPIAGSLIQLMSVLVALDYYAPEDSIPVDDDMLKDVPRGTSLGLASGMNVMVSDLIAAMVYNGSMDAAAVLVRAVEASAGESIGFLMQNKAQQLGMEDTDYTGSDGIGELVVMTTAFDQCELYLAVLKNDALLSIIKSGTYFVLTEDEKGRLPAKLNNSITAAVPENRLYDVRLSTAVSCSVEYKRNNEKSRYNAMFFHAVDYRADIGILCWMPASSATIQARSLYNLTDVFVRRKIIDLIPYIEVAANALSVEKSGVKISGWFLTEGHIMYGRQMTAFDPDEKNTKKTTTNTDEFDLSKMSVLLKPELSTLVNNDDGSRTISAKVLVNNSVEGTVTLSTAPKATQTEVSQNTNTVYTEDDVLPEMPTMMSQYGWIIITAGVVLLGLIVIIIGVVIRNRME